MTDRYDVNDEQLAAARREVEQMLEGSGVSLSDRELWEEPVDLDFDVAAAHAAPRLRRARRWSVVAGIAAVLGFVVLLAAVILLREPGPDWEVALIPTAEAPSASAVVAGWNQPGGTRLRLDVSGLEPAPDGYVYELWFTNQDRHISAGTFTRADDLEMWVGVRRGDFPRVWITLEPLDADPGPALTVLDVES